MLPVDAILSLGGLIFPPAVDLIKKIFIKPGKDTPEATMSTLATTKPEALAGYVDALGRYMTAKSTAAQVEQNVDVPPGQVVPPWVVALRSSIRPIVVSFGLFHIFWAYCLFPNTPIPVEIRGIYEVAISSWFGSRVVEKGT